jgi:hypothetical protein
LGIFANDNSGCAATALRAACVALCALVDDLVAKRAHANDKRLTALQWKSGTNMRFIEFVALFGRKRSRFVVALLTLLITTQTQHAYSDNPAPGTSTVNTCNPSNSDFEAGLKQLAETVTDRTDIPPDFLQKYFTGCTIEKAREFLNKSGFRAGKPEPEFDDSEPKKVIPRTIVAGKTMRSFDQLVSLNCRIVLENDASNGLSVFGFFYFDGP